jgi:glutathione S-transferase
MLKLHGFAVSNYFNMARMALLEKGTAFQVVKEFPSQEPDYLGRSPVGKVPFLETPGGFLAETAVILEYIEETVAGPRFLPPEAWARARVRQAMHMMELYIELPARRLYPGVFFGGSNAEHTVKEVEPVLRRGVAGLARILKCDPWLMGAELTLADFFATFAFPLAATVARKTWDWDMLAELPGLGDTLARLNDRPSAALCNAESRTAMAEFMAKMQPRR